MTSSYELILGNSLDALAMFPAESIDSIVADPPYELGFMGKSWDASGIAFDPRIWRACLRVLKPGGHLLAFGGARTYHRLASAIEDAGFEVRDQIMWIYGSGFPKSLNVSKAIDKVAGAERIVVAEGKPVKRLIPGADQNATGSWIKDNGRIYVPNLTAPATDAARAWEGWGTALKPAHEPICVARKPFVGNVAANVLAHGTGALNIDACRVPTDEVLRAGAGGIPCRHDENTPRGRAGEASADRRYTDIGGTDFAVPAGPRGGDPSGRWPANVIHDGSDEVLSAFPDAPGQQGDLNETGRGRPSSGRFGDMAPPHAHKARLETNKSAARFFYCAKASRADRNDGVGSSDAPAVETNAMMRERENVDWPARNGNHHPTVKPTDLMAYCCRLVTPPGGIVLDPFMGSGSTGKGAIREGFNFVGVELRPDYFDIAHSRIAHECARLLAAEEQAALEREENGRQGDLFAGAA